MFQTLNLKAVLVATVVTLGLIASVIVGSRNLQNFDGALVAYLFGTIFACFGIVYRYVVWLQRPPTWRYWVRGWQLFFSGKMLIYGWELAKHFFNDFLCQKFIYHRGTKRWIAHLSLVIGCVMAFAVTIPLTWGWIHFGLKQGTIDTYEAYLWGFKTMEFPLHTWIAFNIFHILDWCSVLVIIGVTFMMRRRLTDAGQIAIQTFEGDWLPLILLLAISVTGLGLTWDYEFMQGKAHQFMAISHAISVILFLIWLPFGKFFHLFQRPAQLGVAIYRKEGEIGEQAICPHTEQPFASKLHINDLKEVTKELGFNYELQDGTSHLDLSPQGKRAALAKAHLAARKKSGSYFG
ncbi:MAG: MFS transporter [Verrucomicrobia bacterium Tous-C9LFEB]|nr:MAG: MFS transporter [Verrucomicrobia bacterium Tous-C9LFEB]